MANGQQQSTPDLSKIVAESSGKSDTASVKEEEESLTKLAKSAALRAEVSHRAHLKTLVDERDRLRDQIDELQPRVLSLSISLASIQQAETNAKQAGGIVAFAMATCGILFAASGYCVEDVWRVFWLATGGVACVGGLTVGIINTVFGWPLKTDAEISRQ